MAELVLTCWMRVSPNVHVMTGQLVPTDRYTKQCTHSSRTVKTLLLCRWRESERASKRASEGGRGEGEGRERGGSQALHAHLCPHMCPHITTPSHPSTPAHTWYQAER